jgi:hypothetical protein
MIHDAHQLLARHLRAPASDRIKEEIVLIFSSISCGAVLRVAAVGRADWLTLPRNLIRWTGVWTSSRIFRATSYDKDKVKLLRLCVECTKQNKR